jgi:hypothetical protein
MLAVLGIDRSRGFGYAVRSHSGTYTTTTCIIG